MRKHNKKYSNYDGLYKRVRVSACAIHTVRVGTSSAQLGVHRLGICRVARLQDSINFCQLLLHLPSVRVCNNLPIDTIVYPGIV